MPSQVQRWESPTEPRLSLNSEIETSTDSMSVYRKIWRSLWQVSETRSEKYFFIFVMGVCIGLILGTLRDPLWVHSLEAPFVLYAYSTVIVCSAKIIALRFMMIYVDIDDREYFDS